MLRFLSGLIRTAGIEGPIGRAGMHAGLVLEMTCTEGKRFLRIFAIELCAELMSLLRDSALTGEGACSRQCRISQPVG
ncbi:hypothetical protein BK669_02395 [Pseudomonas fluorescens]|nr:hypothetical protein BK669_02395 [Pseudomonas fluorescens]